MNQVLTLRAQIALRCHRGEAGQATSDNAQKGTGYGLELQLSRISGRAKKFQTLIARTVNH